MIADLSAADGPTQLTCDLCVVGTGAAGLTIASEMLDTSLNVVLVESGGLDFEPPTQSLYDVDISGFLFYQSAFSKFCFELFVGGGKFRSPLHDPLIKFARDPLLLAQ